MDPVVAAAMDTLTALCNAHSFDPIGDKATAMDAFRMLLRNGHTYTTPDIAAAADARGWSVAARQSLVGIAQARLDGQILRSSGRSVLEPTSLSDWRRAAAGPRTEDSLA